MDGELFSTIRTVRDKHQALEQIDILLNGLNNKDLLDNLNSIGQEIQALAAKAKSAESFLQEAKEKIASMPVVRLTVVFQPTDKQITELALLVKSEISTSAVLEVHLDSFLGAGALVEYNGQYYDGSLASQLA